MLKIQSLYPFLSGWDNLVHFANMLPSVTEEKIKETVAFVGLDKRIHDKVRRIPLECDKGLGLPKHYSIAEGVNFGRANKRT